MARVTGSSWLDAATKRFGSSQMNVSAHAPRLRGSTRKLTTLRIHFEMNGTLRGHRGGSCRSVVEHESRLVFSEHSRSERAVDRHIDFRGTWMCVWNGHRGSRVLGELSGPPSRRKVQNDSLMATPLPITAGKLPEFADIVRPAAPVNVPTPARKLKTNYHRLTADSQMGSGKHP